MGIAADIQRELDRKGWKLYKLHQESEVLYATLKSIMSADSNPGIDKVVKISRAFGITIDELVQNPKPVRKVEKKPMTPKGLEKVLIEYGVGPDNANHVMSLIGSMIKEQQLKERRRGNGEAEEGPVA
jgi:transcriptional regulator with XRE-family HTH domain